MNDFRQFQRQMARAAQAATSGGGGGPGAGIPKGLPGGVLAVAVLVAGGFALNASLYNGPYRLLSLPESLKVAAVDGGHRAIKYTRCALRCLRDACRADARRLHGVREDVYNEGTHFAVRAPWGPLRRADCALQIPWFETPVIYDIRAKPRSIASLTGTKGNGSVPTRVHMPLADYAPPFAFSSVGP